MRISIFFLWVSTVMATSSLAQQYTIYNLSVPDGLPSSEVYDVFQDANGFLWFATDNGVVKFDGHEMKVYSSREGLPDPVVFGFHEDNENRLWFRCFSGNISYYQNGTIHQYAQIDESYGIINAMYFDTKSKELWLGGANFLGKLNEKKLLSVLPKYDSTLICKTIEGVDILSHHVIAGCVKHINVNGQTFDVDVSDKQSQSNVFKSIRWKDKLYLSLGKDVFQFDGKKVIKKYSGDETIISLSVDKDDQLWIGYLNGGTKRFSKDDLNNSWSFDFLKNKSVSKILQDNDGGFWFTTLENGVYHVPNFLITNHTFDGLSKVKAVASNGNEVLVGDLAGNVQAFNQQTKSIKHQLDLRHPVITIFPHEETVWISTGFESYILNLSHQKIKTLPASFVSISQLPGGTMLTYGGASFKKYNAAYDLITNVSMPNTYRSMLSEDSLLYLAGRVGLQIRDLDLSLKSTPKSLSTFKISSITNLNDTTLLVGTSGSGFLIVNKNNFNYEQFDTRNKFLANNVYAVIKDKNMLWFATEAGVAIIHADSLVNGDIAFKYLNKNRGLIDDKINFLANTPDEIWAFSDYGFSVIPKDIISTINLDVKFYLKTLTINEKQYSKEQLQDLAYDQHDLNIEFGYISLSDQNIHTRYRIDKHHNWINLSNNQIELASLAPGHYNFEIQYSIDNNHWYNATDIIQLTINPLWWMRWYTILAALLILLVLAYWYFRYQRSVYNQKNHYLKIINEHQQKLIQSEIETLERERNRISKELHDRVGTNLTAIKLMVSQTLQNYNPPVAAEVEEQFQIAIEELKEILYALTPPSLERYGLFTGLKNYIGKLNNKIPIPISLQTFGEESNNYDLNIIIFRVIQELLSNSIKHSRAKNIVIHISSFDDMINIVYEDDGVGFYYNPEQSGLGLDNIDSRIRSINGTLKFESGKFGISYTIDIPLKIKKEVF